jgi:hypothetical protein
LIFVILGHLIVPTTLGQNVAHVIGNNTMLERKGNNLVVKFDASGAHGGL